MKLRDETIGGIDVEIHVNARNGVFEVSKDGAMLAYGESMEQAIKRARPKLAQRKVRVEVPFITKKGERSVATGIHARSRAVLARIGGESVQLGSFHEQQVLKPDMPADTLKRYLTLRGEIATRQKEMKDIEREYEFEISRPVRQAIEAKAQELAAAEPD